MAVDLYISATSGSDGNNGTGPGTARRNPSKILELIDNPVDDQYVVHVDGSVGTPQSYIYDGVNMIDHLIRFDRLAANSGVKVSPSSNVGIVFQADAFDEGDYNNGDNPFGNSKFDPAENGDWPVVFPPLSVERCPGVPIEFRGIQFQKSDTETEAAVMIESGSDVEFDYCALTGCNVGARLVGTGAAFRNCFIHDNTDLGILAYQSHFSLEGNARSTIISGAGSWRWRPFVHRAVGRAAGEIFHDVDGDVEGAAPVCGPLGRSGRRGDGGAEGAVAFWPACGGRPAGGRAFADSQ
ncbi:MAG: hypothetical protein M5R36_26695 [Deltaproteobacteria bacterium]|nr:hypothetical protein [Deltaproteobacteria bacterium]